MAHHKDKKHICVSGLGFIGLPTACVLANSGYTVLGIDTNLEVVSHIKSLKFRTLELNLQPLLEEVITAGRLKVSTKVEPADIHIIAVPTPLTSEQLPDLSFLHAALQAIEPHLRPQDLVLVESTSPIGTTDSLAKKLQEHCSEVYIAYCPERVLPGNILHELIYNARVVGGINEASTVKAVDFYKSFVQGEVVATNAKTAEAIKLAENTYRDINIAYANELSMMADYHGLDIQNLINLANKHPRVQIHQPGPGVGGHCIPLSPKFLASSNPNYAKLITTAREINNEKTKWVIEKIKRSIRESNAKIVACLGLTYKPNVPDFRGSPSLIITESLAKDAEVLRVDPYLPDGIGLEDALKRADIIIGLVAHREFHDISVPHLNGKIVFDFAGVFK